MAIPEIHKWRYIFHFTDIRNLDSIIKNGVLCMNDKKEKGITHKNIANATIQERRAKMDVPIGKKGKVHDYVPFYFSSMNPMLLTLLNHKNVDQNLIIYLCVKIQRLDDEDVVFTDASANTVAPPNFYTKTTDLDKLKWDLIDSKKWGGWSDEDRHRKMAEALVYKRVDISDVDAIVVYNEWGKKKVQELFDANGKKAPEILFDHAQKIRNYSFYYTKFFFSNRMNDTLVTGPVTLLAEFKELLESIAKNRQKPKDSYPYETPTDLVLAIEKDFDILPELKAIIGLQQDYAPHNDTVDVHTRAVVTEMKQTAYYQASSDELRSVLELAAYLHDIGKGPKEQWKEGKMTSSYPDHPADAIPMLKRILSDEVKEITEDEIRRLCIMVVYHDIIGECMEKDRDKQQIVDLIGNEDDLDMLFAISIADAKAVNGFWGRKIVARQSSFRKEILKLKNV